MTFVLAPELQRVVLELSTPSGPRYFSDGRYVDAPAGLIAEARISNRISFERSLNTAYWSGSGRAVSGVGAVELVNTDGALDSMLSENLRDRIVLIRLGSEKASLASMPVVARAIVEHVETVGESSLRLVLGDATRELAKPIQTVTIPSGPFAGRPYPLVIGLVWSVPALHTEAPTLRFGIHDSAAAGRALSNVQAVLDSGVALTSGTQWSAYSTAPSFGFTLNQATSGRILANAIGPGPNFGFNNASLNGVVRYLLETRLGWATSRVDAAGYSALDVELGFSRFGRYVDDPLNYDEFMDVLADSIGGWWAIDTGGVLRMDRLRLPAGTPVLEIDRGSIQGEIQVEFDAAPGLSGIVAGFPNAYPMSESEQATSIRDTALGADLRKPYRTLAPFALHAAYQRNATAGDSGAAGMPTILANNTSASNEASFRATIWATPKWWYPFRVLLDASTAATLPVGAVVRVTHPRYGLESGRLLRVKSVRGEIGQGLVDLVCWGDGPAPSGGKG